MNDLVSIIVPVFNRRSAIREALESILKQTYEHWEALVVDDGSTDGTARVVEEYSRADSRVRLLRHGQRKGAQAARNTGIRDAQGEWIAFLDSDDQWLLDSLKLRLRLAVERGLHVVHSDCYVLKPGSAEVQRFGVPPIQGQVYRELLQRPGPVFPAMLVSRKALESIADFDEQLVAYQEWDTAIRLAKHYCYGFVEEPTFVYDCRGTDTISKDALRNALGYERVFHKHARAILRHAGPRALARHYQSAASWYQLAGDESAVRRCMLMALLWWPFRLGAITRRFKQDPVRKGSG